MTRKSRDIILVLLHCHERDTSPHGTNGFKFKKGRLTYKEEILYYETLE